MFGRRQILAANIVEALHAVMVQAGGRSVPAADHRAQCRSALLKSAYSCAGYIEPARLCCDACSQAAGRENAASEAQRTCVQHAEP